MTQLVADDRVQKVSQFLELATADAIQLVAIPAEGGAPKVRWFGVDVAAAAAWAAELNAQEYNIYWSVNRVRSGLNTKAEKGDILGIRYAHVDIDPPKASAYFDKDDVRLTLDLLELCPSFVVDSGGGLQAFWRCDDNLDLAEVESLNRAIAKQLSGDHCHNADRIMRVAGTVNWPGARKRERGRVPAIAHVLRGFTDRNYGASQLQAAFLQQTADTGGAMDRDLLGHAASELNLKEGDSLHRLLHQPQGNDRSKDTFAAACALVQRGLSDEAIMSVLLDPHTPISAHCLDQADPDRAAQRAISNARASGLVAPIEMGEQAISATPYSWPEPDAIPTRKWLYGRQLLRGTLSLMVAPGATGKTALTIGMALSLASGQPLLGKEIPSGPQKVWLWNLEDSREELDRALAGARLFHQIDEEQVAGRLFVDSGLAGAALSTAIQTREGCEIAAPVFDALAAELVRQSIDVLIVDPFVSSHSVPENDNMAIDAVTKAWAKLAATTGCSILLVHHTAKSNGSEVTAERARGAVAMVNTARSVVTVNRMTADEAQKLGVVESERRRYIRTFDDKNNRAPPAESSDWYRIESISLPNGEGEGVFGDSVGVVAPWSSPTSIASPLEPERVARLQELVANGEWREDARAELWVGKAVAMAFDLCADDKADRARIKAILQYCHKNGWLSMEQRSDSHRHMRHWTKVGTAISTDLGTQ